MPEAQLGAIYAPGAKHIEANLIEVKIRPGSLFTRGGPEYEPPEGTVVIVAEAESSMGWGKAKEILLQRMAKAKKKYNWAKPYLLSEYEHYIWNYVRGGQIEAVHAKVLIERWRLLEGAP